MMNGTNLQIADWYSAEVSGINPGGFIFSSYLRPGKNLGLICRVCDRCYLESETSVFAPVSLNLILSGRRKILFT